MDGNRHYPYDVEPLSNGEHSVSSTISTQQLQHLVRLLDRSDVAEIEVKRITEGTRLVLRKAKTEGAIPQVVPPEPLSDAEPPPVETKHPVVAALVGIFHTWAKPKGGSLVVLGDSVKEGQLVGTIQSLNVLTEVEAPSAGRVTEIFVQDGQAVEYGQVLMIIDSSEEG